MDDLTDKVDHNTLKLIFFLQIGLVVLIMILFAIGYFDTGIRVGAFSFSLILGAMGASISLMRRLRSGEARSPDAAKDFKLIATLMPILYGTLMAGVAYLFFMSGILSGDGGNGLLTTNLFPNFSGTKIYNENIMKQFVLMRPASMQDTGKLLVWCFLAGYSERFVTGILQQLESNSQT